MCYYLSHHSTGTNTPFKGSSLVTQLSNIYSLFQCLSITLLTNFTVEEPLTDILILLPTVCSFIGYSDLCHPRLLRLCANSVLTTGIFIESELIFLLTRSLYHCDDYLRAPTMHLHHIQVWCTSENKHIPTIGQIWKIYYKSMPPSSSFKRLHELESRRSLLMSKLK